MLPRKKVAVGRGEPSPGWDGHKGSGRGLVVRAPGGRLRRLAQLCFSKAANTTVFEPILDGLCAEYFEALAVRDLVQARFARLRGYASFWLAIIARIPISLIKLFL